MTELQGRTVGQYQLIEIIDQTGAALVYKGFQPNMNRYVAVKLLKPGVARDPAIVQRFIQQGELLAQMSHPNLLPVYDAGREEGIIYRVSRFIEGGTVKNRLYEFQDPRQALSLISGIVDGLEYIHKQGMIHGNLKPSNIFLDESKHPLLTDFGIPMVSSVEPSPYASPEQVQGGVVDRRADIYALGVLLYELLTGEAPPAGVVISPRVKRPDLPESVERVIFKAMAQNPDARFQSAIEFRNALDASLRPIVPTQQPIPTPQQFQAAPTPPPPPKKGPNWLAIILGLLLVIIICFAGVYLGNRLLTNPDQPPTEQPPIEVTIIPPTREERPTREPRPTEPPIEASPTSPDIEPPPTEPIEPPIETPPGGDGPGDIIGEICGSTGMLIGIVAMVGLNRTYRRKQKR